MNSSQADFDADSQLSPADMRHYWTTLGSLLSVGEVGEWVEHAVQLPGDVAQLFLDSSVSGYDFAELARDTSESGALRKEVGVRTQRQRNTLARAMRMRLTGVGRPPNTAAPLVALGAPKCTSVHLAWAAADGGGFPTHKYRLERHARKASQSTEPRDLPLSGHPNDSDLWTLVADGYFHDFIDEHLLPGVSYDYRIAAWNAIGRSGFETAHFSTDTRSPCDFFEYLGAWAILTIGRFSRSSLRVIQYVVIAFILFFAALRMINPNVRFNWCHLVFTTLRFMRKSVPSMPGCKRDILPPEAVSTKTVLERNNHRPRDYLLRPLGSVRTARIVSSRSNGSPYLSVICNGCQKPFIMAFRSRHYCFVCASSFCKRCGVVRHSNMVTCPVGSKCCCARCNHDQLAHNVASKFAKIPTLRMPFRQALGEIVKPGRNSRLPCPRSLNPPFRRPRV